jgi:hypothetical protein
VSDDLLVPSAPELLAVLRRHWRLALGVSLVVFFSALAYLASGDTTYTAVARVQLDLPSTRLAVEDGEIADSELERLRRDEVERAAAERLGRAPQVAVAQLGRSTVFSITASSPRPDVVEAANAYAEAFVDLRRTEVKEAAERRIDAVQRRIAELQQARPTAGTPAEGELLDRRLEDLGRSLDQAAVAAAQTDDVARVFEPASATAKTSEDSAFLWGAAGVLALLTGLATPLVFESIRGRVHSESDLRRLMPETPVLATVPADPTAGDLTTASVSLRTVLEATATGTPSVVAIAPFEDASVAGALALGAARQMAGGSSVVLVDATGDAQLTVTWPAPTRTGLLDMIAGAAPPATGSVPSGGEVAVVPHGSGDAALLLSSSLRDVLTDLGKQYRHVLVLSPSVDTTAGLAVASAAGKVAIVGKAGRTTVSKMRRASTHLRTAAVVVLGTLLETVDRPDISHLR